MNKQATVTINGRRYDAISGLPIDAPSQAHTTRQSLRAKKSSSTPQNTSKQPHQLHPATSVHKKTQRSNTLNRKFIKKPTNTTLTPSAVTSSAAAPTATPTVPTQKVTPSPSIERSRGQRIDGLRPVSSRRSPARSHQFLSSSAKRNTVLQPHQPIKKTPPVTVSAPASMQEAPAAHPIISRVHSVQAQKKAQPSSQQPPTASVLKQAAINEAMDQAPKHHAKRHKHASRRSRFFGLASAFAALVLFAGYLTYLNVPNLSVRVAAAQAGIDASYPGYQPDGYKLNGPVAFSDGEVRMKFTANTGTSEFALVQSRSGWDSGALLENFVKEKSNGDYTTSQEKGITVYSYQGNAAWVSGGILYTIDGDAPLNPNQIRKIATSV